MALKFPEGDQLFPSITHRIVHASDDSTNTASADNTLIGPEASITPRSTSSRILIIGQMNLCPAGGDCHVFIQKHTGSWATITAASGTASNNGTAALGSSANGRSGWDMNTNTFIYVDSPNTTSSIQYRFAAMSTGGGLAYNRQNNSNQSMDNDEYQRSHIILMELES